MIIRTSVESKTHYLYYTLFAFLEAVDQNPFLWVSQNLLIIAAILLQFLVLFHLKNVYFSTLRDMIKMKFTASRITNGVYHRSFNCWQQGDKFTSIQNHWKKSCWQHHINNQSHFSECNVMKYVSVIECIMHYSNDESISSTSRILYLRKSVWVWNKMQSQHYPVDLMQKVGLRS